MVGNGLTDGQWWPRRFYDLLVRMCCKFLNLKDMTKKCPLQEKSPYVMPFHSALRCWILILSYIKLFLIILAVLWTDSLWYSYSTFNAALHSTDVVIEVSLAKQCDAENSLGLFSFTRFHLAFSHADSSFNSASGYVGSYKSAHISAKWSVKLHIPAAYSPSVY